MTIMFMTNVIILLTVRLVAKCSVRRYRNSWIRPVSKDRRFPEADLHVVASDRNDVAYGIVTVLQI